MKYKIRLLMLFIFNNKNEMNILFLLDDFKCKYTKSIIKKY